MKTILIDAVNTFIVNGEIDEKLHHLLESYSNPKIILTNADDAQMVSFGLVNLPYPVFTLKHNPDKIIPKYFEIMLAHYNLKAEDVIYFEHNADAVKSAQSVGIIAHHFDKEKRDLVELKRFLDWSL